LDIFALLSEEHRRIAALFRQLDAAILGEDERRDALFRTLMDELTAHKEAEEGTFYAALSTLPEATDLTEESMEGHADIAELLDELASLPADADFTAALAELREEVEHHVGVEENELFPVARRILSEEQAAKLAEAMRREMTRLTA
jgi:hemerythrin-like domain-containing protein